MKHNHKEKEGINYASIFNLTEIHIPELIFLEKIFSYSAFSSSWSHTWIFYFFHKKLSSDLIVIFSLFSFISFIFYSIKHCWLLPLRYYLPVLNQDITLSLLLLSLTIFHSFFCQLFPFYSSIKCWSSWELCPKSLFYIFILNLHIHFFNSNYYIYIRSFRTLCLGLIILFRTLCSFVKIPPLSLKNPPNLSHILKAVLLLSILKIPISSRLHISLNDQSSI